MSERQSTLGFEESRTSMHNARLQGGCGRALFDFEHAALGVPPSGGRAL